MAAEPWVAVWGLLHPHPKNGIGGGWLQEFDLQLLFPLARGWRGAIFLDDHFSGRPPSSHAGMRFVLLLHLRLQTAFDCALLSI